MSIQDDIFDIRATLQARRSKDRDAMVEIFDGLMAYLGKLEVENETLYEAAFTIENAFASYEAVRPLLKAKHEKLMGQA